MRFDDVSDVDDVDLKEVWKMIVKKMNKEGEEVCPNSSSFYKYKMALSVLCEEKREI